MTDFGETFRVAGHHVRRAEPPEEFRTPSGDGAQIIGYECVDCGVWGQAVSEFEKSICDGSPDHRGPPQEPVHLLEAVGRVTRAYTHHEAGHRDTALAVAEEAEAHIEDYRRGPLLPKDADRGEADE